MMVPLSEIILTLESGVSVNSDDSPADSIEPGVLKVSCVSGGRFFPRENKRIHPSETGRASVTVRAGDLLVSRANTFDLIGACGIVDCDYPNLYLPDKLWRVVLRDPKGDYIPWLNHVLNSPSVRTELRKRATGTSGSMKNIPQTSFLGIPVFRPPYREQEEIASVLNVWDRGVRQVTDLIAAKLRFKQGLMQQLLTGKRRFPEFQDGWKRVRIGDVANETSERNGGGASLPVLSCTKYDGLVDSLQYFGKRVFSENTENYKVVRRTGFAYATNHIEEGSIGLLSHVDAGLVSPMYTVFRTNDEVVPDFLYRLLKTETYRQVFASFTSASVNRRGSLRWKQFATIPLKLPSLKEQQRVNAAFSVFDQELDLLRQQLERLKRQKKGLMQRLLTGQVRVKLPKGDA